ncbi:MAG TPA: PepSY domain-containing protein [Streptosporangiaceae bacterium]|nr:PepSY domain-containing protein [Streptosporangiaceae bacterium]
MRKMIGVGVGAAAVAMTLGTAAGVASASSSHQATNFATVMASKHITKAQAKKIAEAKVPHSKAIEVESDDLHDVAVWKVTLAVPHGRVIVDVNKRTGKATIVKHEKRGDDGQRGDRRDRDEQRAADDWRGQDERRGHDDRRGDDHGKRHHHRDSDRDRGHDEHDG